MERLMNRVMIACCSIAVGGILMKFLYAMLLCNLYIKLLEGITQGTMLRGWIL